MAIIVDIENLSRVFERKQAGEASRLYDSDFETPQQIGRKSNDMLAGFAVAPSYVLTGRDDAGRTLALIPITGVCAVGQKDVKAGHNVLIETCYDAIATADEINYAALNDYYEKTRRGAFANVHSWTKEPATRIDLAQNISASASASTSPVIRPS